MDHRGWVHGFTKDPLLGFLLKQSDTPLAIAAHRQTLSLDFLVVLDTVWYTFAGAVQIDVLGWRE